MDATQIQQLVATLKHLAAYRILITCGLCEDVNGTSRDNTLKSQI